MTWLLRRRKVTKRAASWTSPSRRTKDFWEKKWKWKKSKIFPFTSPNSKEEDSRTNLSPKSLLLSLFRISSPEDSKNSISNSQDSLKEEPRSRFPIYTMTSLKINWKKFLQSMAMSTRVRFYGTDKTDLQVRPSLPLKIPVALCKL